MDWGNKFFTIIKNYSTYNLIKNCFYMCFLYKLKHIVILTA